MGNLSDKINSAIERLKYAAKMSKKYMDSPLYVCISGGKDSTVLQQLAIEAGIDCIFTHTHTSIDAPTTVYFIRNELKRLSEMGYRTQTVYPKMNMFKLIEHKNAFMPTAVHRYCCGALKEGTVRLPNGKGAFIAVGVRWQESWKRKETKDFEVRANSRSKAVRVQMNDNDIEAKLFETCALSGQRVVNPILDWTNDDIWEYIKSKNIPYNDLYNKGFKRVGCIGCPLSRKADRIRYFDLFPGYKRAYVNAIGRGLVRAKAQGVEQPWGDAESIFRRWVYGE